MFKVPDTENVFGLLVFMNVSGFFFFFYKEMQKAMKILVTSKGAYHMGAEEGRFPVCSIILWIFKPCYILSN